jgi:hypothetical protein
VLPSIKCQRPVCNPAPRRDGQLASLPLWSGVEPQIVICRPTAVSVKKALQPRNVPLHSYLFWLHAWTASNP